MHSKRTWPRGRAGNNRRSSNSRVERARQRVLGAGGPPRVVQRGKAAGGARAKAGCREMQELFGSSRGLSACRLIDGLGASP